MCDPNSGKSEQGAAGGVVGGGGVARAGFSASVAEVARVEQKQ